MGVSANAALSSQGGRQSDGMLEELQYAVVTVCFPESIGNYGKYNSPEAALNYIGVRLEPVYTWNMNAKDRGCLQMWKKPPKWCFTLNSMCSLAEPNTCQQTTL